MPFTDQIVIRAMRAKPAPVLALAAALALAGCGQTGPLYLPEAPPKQQPATADAADAADAPGTPRTPS